MQERLERNSYYDTVKGVVSLNILLIHTAFWSGNSYAPDWIRNVVLLIDVPVFFLISGACQHYVESYKKQIESLIRMYKKWIAFLLVYWAIVVFLGGNITFKSMLLNLLFRGGNESVTLPVVMGSIWFFPVYYVVVVIGSYVIHNLKCQITSILILDLLLYGCCVFAYEFCNAFIIKQTIKLTFYLAVFLIGYQTHEMAVDVKLFFFVELVSVVASAFYLLHFNSSMFSAKSPPVYGYAVYETVSIVLILYARKYCPISKYLSIIGRNSLYFFFAQGISSSLLYYISDYIVVSHWYVKYFACSLINAVLGVIITYLLTKYYRFLKPLFK